MLIVLGHCGLKGRDAVSDMPTLDETWPPRTRRRHPFELPEIGVLPRCFPRPKPRHKEIEN
jgi:hypothetical protein